MHELNAKFLHLTIICFV